MFRVSLLIFTIQILSTKITLNKIINLSGLEDNIKRDIRIYKTLGNKFFNTKQLEI
jgi:hypothetical protein